MELTQARLKELLHYDPGTGVFTWVKVRGRMKAASVAGNLNSVGYWVITINWKTYGAHRLAWLYTYGTFPSNQIDHINGVRIDNKLSNLRDVTQSENMQNQTKVVGAYKASIGPSWFSSIYVGGVSRHLGSFPTKEEARQAYLEAKKIHHPTSPIVMETNND